MIWDRETTVTIGTDKKTIKVCVYILANRVRNHYRLVIIKKAKEQMILEYLAKDVLFNKQYFRYFLLKDTHREKAPSSKPPVFTDSMNMAVSLVQ